MGNGQTVYMGHSFVLAWKYYLEAGNQTIGRIGRLERRKKSYDTYITKILATLSCTYKAIFEGRDAV